MVSLKKLVISLLLVGTTTSMFAEPIVNYTSYSSSRPDGTERASSLVAFNVVDEEKGTSFAANDYGRDGTFDFIKNDDKNTVYTISGDDCDQYSDSLNSTINDLIGGALDKCTSGVKNDSNLVNQYNVFPAIRTQSYSISIPNEGDNELNTRYFIEESYDHEDGNKMFTLTISGKHNIDIRNLKEGAIYDKIESSLDLLNDYQTKDMNDIINSFSGISF